MKLDFQDKRLMQQATGAGTGGDPYAAKLKQAENAWNTASQAAKSNPNDPAAQKAQQEAGAAYINAAIEAGILKEGSAAWNKLAQVAPTLAANLATFRQDLGKTSAEKELDLIRALRDANRDLLKTEVQAAFNLGMMSPQTTVSLMSTIKAFAQVLDLFGIDTDSFVKKCDEKIEVAKAEMGQMNTARLNQAPTDVSSIAAEANVAASTARAQDEIIRTSPQKMAEVIGAIQQASGSGSAPTPAGTTVASTQLSAATSASFAKLLNGDVITVPQNAALRSGFKTADENNNGTLEKTEAPAFAAIIDRNIRDKAKAAEVKLEFHIQ